MFLSTAQPLHIMYFNLKSVLYVQKQTSVSLNKHESNSYVYQR